MTLIAVLSSIGSRAIACSFGPPMEHFLDPAEEGLDTLQPESPSVVSVVVTRGRGEQPMADYETSCRTTNSSCDDIGSLAIQLEASVDDRTATESLGYRFEILTGKSPIDFYGGFAMNSVAGDPFWFHWIDDATDNQEALDFSFHVFAVDLAGNESAPSDSFPVFSPSTVAVALPTCGEEKAATSTSPTGCATGTGPVSGTLLLALPALGLRRRLHEGAQCPGTRR